MIRYKCIIICLYVGLSAFSGKAQNAGQLIFADNFLKETLGKFPANWESNVHGEIISVKNEPGKWLKMHTGGTYMPLLTQNFPENFKVEFEFIYEALGTDYNITEITIFSKKPDEAYDVSFPGNDGIKIFLENFIVSYACYSQQKMDDKLAKEHRTNIIQTDKMVKVSIKVTHQEVNIYINNQHLLTSRFSGTALPFNALRFHLWGSQAEPLISNLKITVL
jgi:hypothetical protein